MVTYVDFPEIVNERFKKIRPVGAEVVHANGQTDRQADGHDEAKRRLNTRHHYHTRMFSA
jgi:hypothetical protein